MSEYQKVSICRTIVVLLSENHEISFKSVPGTRDSCINWSRYNTDKVSSHKIGIQLYKLNKKIFDTKCCKLCSEIFHYASCSILLILCPFYTVQCKFAFSKSIFLSDSEMWYCVKTDGQHSESTAVIRWSNTNVLCCKVAVPKSMQ